MSDLRFRLTVGRYAGAQHIDSESITLYDDKQKLPDGDDGVSEVLAYIRDCLTKKYDVRSTELPSEKRARKQALRDQALNQEG